MGFWGKLGKVFSVAGPIAASLIPGGAALSTGMKILKGGLAAGGLAAGAGIVGSKVAKDLSAEDPNSKLLREQGTKMFGQSNPAFESALGTYGKLASGDKDTLSAFTGTGVNDLNRSYTNQIKRAGSTMNRGGAQSKVLAEAPGSLEHEALGLRSDARKFGIDRQGSLGLAGSQAGNQAIGQAGSLGLARRGQNIGIAKDIGEGVGTILDKTGVWNKLGKTMGGIFGGGGGGSSGLPEFSDTLGTGGPDLKLPDFSGAGIGDPGNSFASNLMDPFKNEKDNGSWGQMFSK